MWKQEEFKKDVWRETKFYAVIFRVKLHVSTTNNILRLL